MALQLETLSFQVDSTQLDDARIKIAKLGDAVASLNKPMQDMQRSSAKTAEAIAKSELATEKAVQAKKNLASQASTVTEKVDPLNKLIERLSNTYTDMAAGFSRGESSIMNQARNLGAMGDQLKQVTDILQNIKTLNKDPFDASLGGVRSITQEFERLQQRADLATQGIAMTTKQLGEYSRLASEARGRVVGLGMDPDSVEGQKAYNQLLSQSQKEYLDVLSVVKQLTDAEQQRLAVAKEQERLQKSIDAASSARMQEWAKGVGAKSPELSSMATFYKEQEVAAKRLTAAEDDLILREQKLAFVNKELAAGLTTASANALFKYQKDLEALGKSTDEITKRTAAFRAGLVEKQGHSPIKKIADDAAEARKEVDHLARALGPQITDIFVGLATGQSPLTILLQQGGQLRDQIALAGVESSKMGDSLRTAASYMVTSVKDVAIAIGQLLAGAFTGAGKRIVDFTTAITGTDKAFAALATRMPMLAAGASALVGIIGGAFLVHMTALGVAFFKVQKDLDNLTKSLILTGGSMGMSTASAISMATAMEGVGVSSSKALEVMQAMAKEGGFVRSEIQSVTQSAVEMQKWLGVSVEDTVKQFAKLKGEPVDALIEVAKTTGLIPPEIIATVIALKDQGKQADASALAMKAYADATVQQVQRAKTEYTDFGKFMIELGSTIKGFWETIKGVVIANSPTQELENLRKEMQRNLDFSFTDTQKKYWSAQLESVNRQILRQQELTAARDQETAVNAKNAKVLEEARKIELASLGTLEKLQRDKALAEKRIADAKKDSDLNQVTRNAIISASEKELAKINEDIAKEAKKNNSEADRERKKQENYYDKVMNQAKDYYEQLIGGTENLTKAEIELKKIRNDKKFAKLSPQEQAKAIAEWTKNADIERQKNDLEDFDKATKEFLSSREKLIENLDQSIAKAKQEGALIDYQNSLIGVSTEQREYLLAIYKEELATKEELRKLEEAGFANDSEAVKKVLALGEARKSNIKLLTDDQKRLQEYSKSFEDLFSKMGDAIVDFALTGKWNFGDMVKSMIADLLKFEMQLQMSNLFKGLGGFAGIASSLGFGSDATGGGFTASMESAVASGWTYPQANGGAWMNGIQAFAKGGTFTNSVVSSPTLFKFAKGTGLMGEAGPEAIMPLTRSSDGSLGVRAEGTGSNVQVVINNSSGAQASASETVDSKGNRRIEVTIGEMAAAEISKSGSTSQNNIRSTFGLQPRLARR